MKEKVCSDDFSRPAATADKNIDYRQLPAKAVTTNRVITAEELRE